MIILYLITFCFGFISCLAIFYIALGLADYTKRKEEEAIINEDPDWSCDCLFKS